MIREATQDDIPALRQFLEARIETSMFLLGNLESCGLGNTTHRYGTRFYLRRAAGEITGVFGPTNGGFLTVQLPDLTRAEAQHFAALLDGYPLKGLTGEVDQVEALTAALPVPKDAWHLLRNEPLYRKALHGQPPPQGLRPSAPQDKALLTEWFETYLLETGLCDAQSARDQAPDTAQRAIEHPDHRILMQDGAPVAMAALNAKAGSAVQVGGVFVPKALRKQGLGGRVVDALLGERAQNGATTAILFAASTDAARVYERIGFEHIGAYRLALTAAPITLNLSR